MTVIGVLLIVLAALMLVVTLVGGSGTTVVLDLGPFDLTTSSLGVYLIGVATVLIFVAGLELLRSGMRRSWARRRELKRARALVAEHESREQPPAHRGDDEPTLQTPTGTPADTGTAPDTATGPEHRAGPEPPTDPGAGAAPPRP